MKLIVTEMIKLLKKHNPKSKIVGGTDAAPLERHNFYFNAGADYIGLGDADLSLPEFLAGLKNGKTESKYPNKLIPQKGNIHFVDLELLRELADTSRFSESGGARCLHQGRRLHLGDAESG